LAGGHSKRFDYFLTTVPRLLYNDRNRHYSTGFQVANMSISPLVAVRYDVEALRKAQFPITQDTVYLNHAAVSPIPQRTFDVMQEANKILLLNPSGGFETWFMPRLTALYEGLRQLINAASIDEIVGLSSTSTALNIVAQSLPWQAGDNVVLVDGEFPSNVYPWMRLQDRQGVEVRLIPNQPGMTLEALAPFVDARTRVVTASMVQFFSGHRTDLAAIGHFCHEKGILFVVDGIQAVGHFPVDVQAMGIDIFASGGQKSLMGPPGIGFLYVRRDLADSMRPALIGANSVVDFMHWLKYDLTPLAGAARFALGTTNFSGVAGLQESVTFLLALGVEAIGAYTSSLADVAIDELRALGYDVITPAAHGPIVTFRAPGDETAATALLGVLKSERIFIGKHWNATFVPHFRIALHCYNNQADIDRFMTALKENR
jgi:cysteine desulfurase / selenocysteine lyase